MVANIAIKIRFLHGKSRNAKAKAARADTITRTTLEVAARIREFHINRIMGALFNAVL